MRIQSSFLYLIILLDKFKAKRSLSRFRGFWVLLCKRFLRKKIWTQIYKQQMALQCSYVCMCHMCSHMCGHMGSCVLDILQGIGTAGAGTVSQVGSRMPNNPLLCNYGLLKKSNIHPEECNSFRAFQLFSLQHWPGCDSKLMNSVLLALSPITFHSTEFNICLLNGSQSQYTDSVWAARGERFSLSEILLKEAVTQKSNPESFIKKLKY